VFELEAIAGSDPVFAGRLLGVANSAYFGYAAEISNLRHAILRLGVPLARNVLMNAVFGPLFASSTLAELWRHSKLVAATAHELAIQCGYDRQIAYASGLLHDIGTLAINRAPQSARVEQAGLLAAGFPLVYAETLIYGIDHAMLGGQLLKEWSLPSEIADAVARHHSPESTDSALAAILYLAEDEAAIDAAENLSTGMRRAKAMEITGLDELSASHINRESLVFALAS
jgi:putative nucleotidyltransferase with HDIG domain